MGFVMKTNFLEELLISVLKILTLHTFLVLPPGTLARRMAAQYLWALSYSTFSFPEKVVLQCLFPSEHSPALGSFWLRPVCSPPRNVNRISWTVAGFEMGGVGNNLLFHHLFGCLPSSDPRLISVPVWVGEPRWPEAPLHVFFAGVTVQQANA